MNISVRVVGPADRERVAELLTAQLVEHDLPADAERIERGLDAAFAPHSPAWLLVAERDGEAVGVFLANQIVSVEQGGHALWIEELYVTPSARRKGVARAMLEHVAAKARRRRIAALELEVVPTQAAAFALYRALGFADVNRQRLKLSL